MAQRAAEPAWRSSSPVRTRISCSWSRRRFECSIRMTRSDTLFGAEEVAKTGVEPTQIVDWLSLTGDAVDNIPGVPGVGAKTASEFVTPIWLRRRVVSPAGGSRVGAGAGSLQASAEVVRPEQELVRLKEERSVTVLGGDGQQTGRRRGVARALFGWGFKTMRAGTGGRPPQGGFF